ncbi:MAG: protein-L-isoaspartate O-methyltransferase family protein, partial [Planctomycetaceae bacterium]
MVGMRRNSLLHRLFLMLLLLPAAGGTAVGQQRFELQREAMVQKSLEAEGIRNPRVLEAMRKVPRHEFVRTADRVRSYEDTALPIGNQQTISPPYVVAYMTEVLDPGPEDRVLEI